MPYDDSLDGARAAVRLRRLVEANRSIVAELTVSQVLRRVVDAARDLLDARYAALGVLGADGGIETFLHSGMDAATVRLIGELPKGRGLLGALSEVQHPIRLAALAEDTRSSGVPLEHPALGPFLGVPVRTGSGVYANLWVANPESGEEFDPEDEALLRSLSSTAGVAIANATLYSEALQRHEWLRVSSEVSQRLLDEDEDSAIMLGELARSAQQVARADGVLIAVPVPRVLHTLEVVATSGVGVEEFLGTRFDATDSISWRCMELGRPLVVQDVHERLKNAQQVPLPMPINHVMVFPLLGKDTVRGTITVGRTADIPFTEADLELAEAFAVQATLALEMSDARADQSRIALLEERSRAAHSLHDNVVQRLFAAGLTIQGAASLSTEPAVREQISQAVANLDETIRTLRSSIFDLHQDTTPAGALPSRMLAVVVELTATLGFTPVLELDGRVDDVEDELVAEVERTVRLALREVAQHAEASAARIQLDVDGRVVTLVLTDDGPVALEDRPGEALEALRGRAEERDGAMAVADLDDGGVQLFWTVPLT